MPTDHGAFEMYGFESSLTKEEIVVLAKGEPRVKRMCVFILHV